MELILLSLPVLVPLILVVYVLNINLKESENKFFIAYMTVLIIGNSFSLLIPLAENAEFARLGNAARLIFVFYFNGILLFFVASSIFYKDIFKKKFLICGILTAPVLFTSTILIDYFFTTDILYSGVKFEEGIYLTEFGRLRFLNDLYMISFVILTLYILFKAYPMSDSVKKKEIKILFSLILLASIVSSARLFAKLYPNINLMLVILGPLPIPIAFAYFISWYKLFSPIESALNLAIETLMDGVIVLDYDGKIIMMNPMAEKILGIRFSAVNRKSSQSFQNILEEKFAGEEICTIFKIISRNEYIELYSRETELIKAKKGFLEINASSIKNKKEQLLGTLIKIRDITEKKKSEIALQQEKELSANILDNAGLLMVAIDRKAEIIFCNKELEEITGFKREEIQQSSFAMSVFPDKEYRRKALELLYSPYEGKITKDAEFSITRKNREKRTLSFTSTPINDPNGNFLGTLIIGNDITEKRKAEESLKLLANITRFSVDAIISTDENGIISSWNKGAEVIYGYTSDEIIGKSIRVLDPEQVKIIGKDKEFLTDLKEKGFVTNIERIQVTRDGRYINVQITAFIVRDEIEGKDYYASIVRDITKTKLMEEELNQSSRLAAIGTLAAGVAHEFNNLLAGILGYAQLGKSSGKIEKMEESLDIISKSSEKAKGISMNLLGFAKRQEPQKELNNINEIIESTLSFIEREFEKSDIKVVRKYKNIKNTICDFGQISQVFLNLMTNARDAMIPKSGTFTIETDQNEQNIEIRFSDTGCGIEKKLIDKIFEPFMTTKGARNGSRMPGIGLGLSVSYGIIKSHNGSIKVESKLGEGSTFIINVPIITRIH